MGTWRRRGASWSSRPRDAALRQGGVIDIIAVISRARRRHARGRRHFCRPAEHGTASLRAAPLPASRARAVEAAARLNLHILQRHCLAWLPAPAPEAPRQRAVGGPDAREADILSLHRMRTAIGILLVEGADGDDTALVVVRLPSHHHVGPRDVSHEGLWVGAVGKLDPAPACGQPTTETS